MHERGLRGGKAKLFGQHALHMQGIRAKSWRGMCLGTCGGPCSLNRRCACAPRCCRRRPSCGACAGCPTMRSGRCWPATTASSGSTTTAAGCAPRGTTRTTTPSRRPTSSAPPAASRCLFCPSRMLVCSKKDGFLGDCLGFVQLPAGSLLASSHRLRDCMHDMSLHALRPSPQQTGHSKGPSQCALPSDTHRLGALRRNAGQ